MKYLVYIITIISISFSFSYAQFDDYNLDFKANIKSNDGKQIFALFNRGNVDDEIEGYILLTRDNNIIEGSIQKNGFNFLDPKIFKTRAGSPGMERIINNISTKDITTMVDDIKVEKVFSFEITPVIFDMQSDSLNFLIKGAFYDLESKDNNYNCYNLNYNINLSYKVIKSQFNKTVLLDFFGEHFKGYNCSFTFTKIKKSEEYLYINNNQNLIDGIKKSTAESKIPSNYRMRVGAEYVRYEDSPTKFIAFPPVDYLLRVKQSSLSPVNSLVDKQYNNKESLPVEVYSAELDFPFEVYNKEKSELYKNYKTKKEIFRSKYSVIVVPISLEDDTLTLDIILDYSKITLDNIPRWTTIKKRVKYQPDLPLVITLPKENWSANFTRDGEVYDIYGYSDVEKYIREFLIISVEFAK